MCVINDGVPRQLSLTLIGFQVLGGGFAGGPLPGASFVPEYSARLALGSGIEFDVTASEIPLPAGLQVLIGRDVLAKAEFLYRGPINAFTLTF
jgi:hypothetical protein